MRRLHSAKHVGRCLASRRRRRARHLLLAILALAVPAAAASPQAVAAGQPVRHVWVINLENNGFCAIPAAEPAAAPVCPNPEHKSDPAFLSLLFPSGTLIANYYGVGHESLDNYIAEVSGQAPNADTQDDCSSGNGSAQETRTELTPGVADGAQQQAIGQGCDFPARVKTIADQLQAEGLTWKGYQADMGKNLIQDGGRTACAAKGAEGQIDSYLPKHDNFVWFHSLYDNLAYCEAHVVPLTALRTDLQRVQTTPNLSFITPNISDDGHNGTWDVWLPQYIHLIQSSSAYRQDGMIAVIFDEASGTGAGNAQACCGEIPGPNSPSPGISGQGGGDSGAVILSPYSSQGVITRANSYNHYSLLRSLEDIFGVTTGGADNEGHLGYAAGNGVESNESVGFRSLGCDDVFTVICPPMAAAVASPSVLPGAGLAAGPRAADGSAQWLNPGPQGDDLNGVSCSAATTCVAVGASGSVISTSTGTNWTSQLSGTVSDLNGVSCPAASKVCVAVGAAGTILKTSNGGQAWSAPKSGTTQDLNGVSCPTTSRCYAVGAAGVILASTNGGQTWAEQSSPATFALAEIACPAADTCYVSGDISTETSATATTLKPLMLSTHDSGASWSTAPASGPDRSRAIACASASWCAAGDERGAVGVTSDGQSWSSAGGSAEGRVLGMSCLASKACVAVGEFGSVVTTADGTSWAPPKTLPSLPDLHSVSCPTATACYAVGRNGVVISSADLGQTWSRVGSDGAASNISIETDAGSGGMQAVGSADLSGVSCSGALCAAVGGLGAILISNDGGLSWSLRGGALNAPLQGSGKSQEGAFPSYEPSARPLRAVSCATAATCVSVGDLGTIERSSDRGQTWSLLSEPATHTLTGVSCAAGSSVCFAVGDYGTIVKTTDAGSSWSVQTSGTVAFLNGVSCADATHCAAVGSHGTILATKDGSTWTQIQSGTSAYLAAVSCPKKTRCLAVGEGGTVLAGGKPGSAWAVRTAPSGDDLYGVSCSTKNQCTVAGGNGTVASTRNGGASWKLKGTGTTDGLHGVICPNRRACYAAGEYGAILKVLPKAPKRHHHK